MLKTMKNLFNKIEDAGVTKGTNWEILDQLDPKLVQEIIAEGTATTTSKGRSAWSLGGYSFMMLTKDITKIKEVKIATFTPPADADWKEFTGAAFA